MSDPSGATDLAPPAAPAEPTPSRRAGSRSSSPGSARPWLFVAPVLVTLAVIIGYPVVRAVVMSFQKDSGLNDATGMFEEGGFAGFDNYTHWLLQQCTLPGGAYEACPTGNLGSQFWVAIGITLLFTVVTVALEATIGLGMAVVMGKTFRGRALLRAAVLIPWAIPTAVTARLWEFMFQYDGVVNRVLGTHILWQTDPWWSRFAVIIADVWKTTPFMALLVLAGLQVIPGDVYEAARVDGASAWQRFTHITLPLLKPALLVAVLFRTMDALRLYDLPAIMTQGNPATRTISILVVDQVRQGQNSAAALSVITFLLIFAVAFVLVKVLGANAVATQEEQRKAH
ncbi:carbohydrate ABC transporter permease [Nocardia wallacei]|uniref:carbohydrate ABC transporter permease n=1 Tax=Nocardia wallacei TaxID=480035 RepID=UPI0016570743|nr:sugar ABC transporter permease [Nocardia wallacei]